MQRLRTALIALALGAATLAQAQDATIRRNIAERLPQIGRIDEVSRTPMAGLFEVRVGTEVYYSDAEGNFLLRGELFDTRNRRNLTEERVAKLTQIDFDQLPLKDAFTVVRGDGKRKLALFQDPNCGYCKRFERDLQNVNNVTIHMFLYPILGQDSLEKSRQVWCARDRNKAWTDWMVRNVPIPAAPACDASALERNVALGRKHQITGTPTLVFADGRRVPGAIPASEVEKILAEVK
jgi:thiol:disulfide interchange protein DsbC